MTGMWIARRDNETAYFALAAWCTATKAWHDLPTRYDFPSDARDAARERGIYRLAYVKDGRRQELDVFAVICGK